MEKCKNHGKWQYCTGENLKPCQMKSRINKGHRGNLYTGDIHFICKACRKGIENGQFKIIL